MICCSNMMNIDIDGKECGLVDGSYFIGNDISSLSSVDVINALLADNGESIDVVILDKSELVDEESMESVESYLDNHETNKKMIMVNIIDDEDAYDISDDLCTNVCVPSVSAVCGGPCCSQSICKICVYTTGCVPGLLEMDEMNDYVLSRYLFVAANCVDGKINVINDDDYQYFNSDHDKQAKQFVIIDHGNQENKLVPIDNAFILLSLLIIFIAAAFIIAIMKIFECTKKDNSNDKLQSLANNYGSVYVN